MDWTPRSAIRRLFASEYGASERQIPRWLLLRALGVIYFSAFYSLVFQIRGLIGLQGILPAGEYLQAVARSGMAHARFWYVPSLLWISSGSRVLMLLCWAGMIGSVLLVLNLWPRAMLIVCFVCFLSFVSAAQDFSSYQSDGMLLEAGFICLFFAPPGLRPGLGSSDPPSRASLFLLQWEWLRIYFESGIAKLASGEPQWRNFTAMDEYYQNGPLPTWIGWYLQHLPHWFHASTAAATLVMELGLIWMILLPRRFRIVLFFMVTCWEIGVISTANYCFLNYLVLSLGILLVDDRFLLRFIPDRWRSRIAPQLAASTPAKKSEVAEGEPVGPLQAFVRPQFKAVKLAIASVMLAWIFYTTSVQLLWMLIPHFPLPTTPVVMLEPFRIANQYGLFAVMTRGRYEIEFQGSDDGQSWKAYPFRYKPQALNEPPRIYAPYHPRFDWNLWFASLGSWRSNPIVPNTEVRLLSKDADVLSLFADNPFPNAPPKRVRAVLWQYWFTSMAEKRTTGNWWQRQLLGLYAPTLELQPDGKIGVIEMPQATAPEQ
ncbi:MAG TPA: lipase maturation factor family protein [Terriglobales bacterium]|nr:lipase maturation factor family protein [Terriglobales bacterium]